MIGLCRTLEHFKNLNSVSTPSHNDCNIPYEVIDKSNLNKMISLDEVKCSSKKIRNGKSAGHEDVFPEFPKIANQAIVNLLTLFFNKFLESGVVRDNWSFSVFSIKRDRRNPNNYRGISLTRCLCKVFTSFVADGIQSDLENIQLIGREPAEFREQVGCFDHAFVLHAIISII